MRDGGPSPEGGRSLRSPPRRDGGKSGRGSDTTAAGPAVRRNAGRLLCSTRQEPTRLFLLLAHPLRWGGGSSACTRPTTRAATAVATCMPQQGGAAAEERGGRSTHFYLNKYLSTLRAAERRSPPARRTADAVRAGVREERKAKRRRQQIRIAARARHVVPRASTGS